MSILHDRGDSDILRALFVKGQIYEKQRVFAVANYYYYYCYYLALFRRACF